MYNSGEGDGGGVYASCVYSVAFCSSVRPSGHPHTTANNGEHGTYDRCVDDDTYIHVYTVNTRREK